jgi:hypothetical protein
MVPGDNRAPGPIPGTFWVNDNTIEADPPVANSITTVDGYVFKNMDYYNEDPDKPDAIDAWSTLARQPGYKPKTPVKQVGVDSEVGGTVG